MTKKQNRKPAKKTAAPKAKTPTSLGVKKRATVKPMTKVVSEPKAAEPAHASDPRLPAVGTVIQKRDRHGAIRCECTVEPGGIRYSGALYRSISSAALAAAKDLGRRNQSENGYVFWGLAKPSRLAGDPIPAFERAWGRYLERAEALVRTGVTEANRTKVAMTIAEQAAAIAKLEGSLSPDKD